MNKSSASGRPRNQRGNALVFALLGLVLAALTAVTTMRAQRIQQKHDAGAAEATILDNLRNAANAAIFDQVVTLQAGGALARQGVTVAPSTVGADLVWAPTIAQLTAMGYLPPGWSATRSTLNGAAYSVSLQRVPTGCAPSACGIEGHIVVNGAITDSVTAGRVDGVVVGPILTRIGADSGVSLQPSSSAITGFGNTWTMSNPVAGTPAGVVAVRIGTASAGFSQFVRIGDTRDPDLQGNLTAVGNLTIGGTSTLKGNVSIQNASFNMTAADGTTCVQILPSGTVNISCAGALNAKTGAFTDAAGNTTSITPGAISTTGDITTANLEASGKVGANRLLPTGSYTPGATCTDNNALAGNSIGSGLVLCSAGAWRAIVTQSTAGQACSPNGVFAQQDGVALVCVVGAYVPLTKFTSTGTAGDVCSGLGLVALDAATNVQLLCHANPNGSGTALWYRLNDLVGNMQFIGSYIVTDSQSVPKPACAFTAGYAGVPALQITPSAEGSSDGSFNRYALDQGTTWTVYLRDSSGAALGGAHAVAQSYCNYP